MIRRLMNNIRHDIAGNYSVIMENSGRYQGMLYLSRVSMQLFKAVLLNKKRKFSHIEFYDIWH